MIIGICGLIGSGKNTAAEFLVEDHGFQQFSYAASLKDAVASIFGWDRDMIEGLTSESRRWREQVDHWWANRLSIPHLTPRWVLQHIGTDVLRKHFHDDIWIASAERKILNVEGHVVVSDVRFPNEALSIRNVGGVVIRVKRGSDPEWWDVAKYSTQSMQYAWPEIHPSEYSWAPLEFDSVIENDSSLSDLKTKVNNLVRSLQASKVSS